MALIDQEIAPSRTASACSPLSRPRPARGVQFIREGLRTLLSQQSLADGLGERELIYSAGLFDYLAPSIFPAGSHRSCSRRSFPAVCSRLATWPPTILRAG